MHILSELRNPIFDTPDRQRALRALELVRLLKENNEEKSWQAIKSMIDKLLAEESSILNPPMTANLTPYNSLPIPEEEMQFNWDDLNLNGIVGSGNGTRNEMPEFDFVSHSAFGKMSG